MRGTTKRPRKSIATSTNRLGMYLPLKNNCFTVMRSGSEEGSYLRLVDFVSLNARPRVIKKKKRSICHCTRGDQPQTLP